MILVIGATAHFGRQTVEALLEAGEPVRALTRDPSTADLPAGAEVVRGDLADASTLGPALDGVTAAFLVLPYGLDPATFLGAARDAGVRRIVFLSSGAVIDGADRQPDVIARYHAGVEQAIAASRADWTFLRLLFPAINALAFGMQLKGGDVVRAPYAAATSAPVHERDVAEVAARVLTDTGHSGRAYDLTGPASLTQADQVRVLGEALGRPLVFEEVPDGPVREQMARFMDGDFVNALFDLMAATVGKPAAVTSTVEEITGRPARPFAAWASDHAADFA
ncbi:NAD(P)H-binding protein [Actinomadura fibrosa]|uniref:NAD(P)H-binding protein n=1 Tax=Actinomadura fibrosa TaxID=111802 RepID=A0ABW2XBJ9_9ACTN|nr:NAD(P)H-binding protein [Actinomadura fibrosa]